MKTVRRVLTLAFVGLLFIGCGDDDATTSVPSIETSCSDGIDNDQDGQIDCADGDCAGNAACPTTETSCSDGVDNDNDGLIDCLDGDCATDPACVTPTVTLGGSIGSLTTDPSTVYIIDRQAVVQAGDVLTVSAGTIFKANTGDGVDASTLIIARGGTILADGSAAQPIIFTSMDDGIQPGETASTLNPAVDGGKWGGLIILGRAQVSNGDNDTFGNIEGLPVAFHTTYGYGDQATETRDDADNSGILNYVSIRFTGTELSPNNEIQGLTLGSVGSGTTLSNIEIIASKDDGVECFGGNVNIDNLYVSHQEDDGIDLDMNYSGTISNALVLNYNPATGNDGFEIDGPENVTHNTGQFTITNSTFLNRNAAGARAGRLKSGAQGTFDNCVWNSWNNWIRVDDAPANDNFITNNTLTITNSEFGVAALADAIHSEQEATYGAMLDAELASAANGNSATTSPTGGTTADYSWTWASELGLLP